MKLQPTPIKEFSKQLELTFVRTSAFDFESGLFITYVSLDSFSTWQLIKDTMFPDKEHIFLYMSSAVDVWRRWMSSYRAAQKKANASLPGYSPHFFGISFDIDLKESRRVLTALSKKAFLGILPIDEIERKVLDYIIKASLPRMENGRHRV